VVADEKPGVMIEIPDSWTTPGATAGQCRDLAAALSAAADAADAAERAE
jgi:hypothetical protein